MPHRRLLAALVALAFACLGCSSAYAGQYTLTYDFASDLSGWSGYVEPGYLLCGRGAPAGCPDITTNRIMARPGAAQAVWSQGRWEWTAPPGTTIVGGSLAYRTRMRHPQFFARLKMRADGVTWDAAPALVSEQQTVALTDHVVALAPGFRQIGLALYSHPAVSAVTDAWDDYVTLVRLVVTVEDAAPPGLAWVDGGGLLDGAWHRGDVCATVAIADAQSGVGGVWMVSGGASASWAAPATGAQYQPGIGAAQPQLCLSAAALGDGVHAGSVGGSDASGGLAAALPFTVSVDVTPPAARLVAPVAAAAAQPAVELDVADGTSGVAAVAVTLDGAALPVEVAGGRARGRPAGALAYGPHALAWTVVDAAGNSATGAARFEVGDTAPPVLGSPQPANGAVLGSDDVLAVAVAVSDEASGVDPASAVLALDGAPVASVWLERGVVRGVAEARVAAGAHRLVLTVADHAGNVARLAWEVTVAPAAVPAAGSPAGVSAAGGAAAAGTPATPGGAAGRRRDAAVRAVHARIGAARPLSVVVRLRVPVRLRVALALRCGAAVRTVHARGSARGAAAVRVTCPAAATVALAATRRVLARVAARRLPLRLQVSPVRRAAPTVARVGGRLAELRGRVVLLEALTATGWRRVGTPRADASGRFLSSFAIVRSGQFALRARVPSVAAVPSAPFVLTMR